MRPALGTVQNGIVHLAKGLDEGGGVVARDEALLPLKQGLEEIADEAEFDDVVEAERQLICIACTRARDRHGASVRPGSQFMQYLKKRGLRRYRRISRRDDSRGSCLSELLPRLP